MRFVKILFVFCTAVLLAGLAFQIAILAADGGKPLPRPPALQSSVLIADGGRPLPRPPALQSSVLIADGGRPLPRPPLSSGIAS